MKKICYYCVATHLGGAEKSLLEFLRKLPAHSSLSTRVLLPQAHGPLVKELQDSGIAVDFLEMPPRFFSTSRSRPLLGAWQLLSSLPALVRYVKSLRRYFAEQGIQVVHTTGIKCHLLAWPATAGLNISVVWHLRDILGRGLTRAAMRIAHRGCGRRVKVIANSRATALSFSRRSLPEVIHNGISLENYGGSREANLATRIPTVGIVGVLAKWKGQAEFLMMAHALKRRGVAARFLVVGGQIYDTVGDRGYVAELHSLVHDLGLADRVEFTGYQANIATVLQRLDVLVHASTRPEPFGRVLIEAQACGVPVVASAAGGVPEIVTAGETGLLFAPKDVLGMAAQVERLLEDANLRAKIIRNARARVQTDFAIDAHVKKIISVYEELKA